MYRQWAVLLMVCGLWGMGQPAKCQSQELDLPRGTVPGLPPAPVWNEPVQPLSGPEKLRNQWRALYNPFGLGRGFVTAAIDHAQDNPEEWGGGLDGFGQRFASRMASRAARRTTRGLVAAALHEDPRFFRSGERNIWKRIKAQCEQTVITRTDAGDKRLAYNRFAGAYTSAFVSQLWLPESRDGSARAFRRGSTYLVGDLGTRLLREFWPDIKRGVFRRK